MGIDRIGKKTPSVSPSFEGAGPSRSMETGGTFPGLSPVASAQTTPVQPVRSPLERLQAKEVDFDRYLDIKVDEATAHLACLPPDALQAIRSVLRDRLASDPLLVDLVRTAAGEVSRPSNDD